MLVLALSLQDWSYVATLITVLGLFLVMFQLRQAAESSRIELITGMTTLILTVDQMFVEHPGMRKYFHDNVAPPKQSKELERARAIALAMANTLDHVVGHFKPMTGRTEQAWRIYISEVHSTSPVFRALLAEHRGWWPALQEEVAAPGRRSSAFDRLGGC
jgi:hypothetical protein